MEKDEANSMVLIHPSHRKPPEYDHCDLHLEFFTDSEMAAAQLLMQLSDEDKNSNNYKESTRDKDHDYHDDQEVDQLDHHHHQSPIKIDNGVTESTTWAKIEESFGKELQEICGDDHHHDHDHDYHRGAGKKRKYRSLASIYSGTQPIREIMKMKILKRKS